VACSKPAATTRDAWLIAGRCYRVERSYAQVAEAKQNGGALAAGNGSTEHCLDGRGRFIYSARLRREDRNSGRFQHSILLVPGPATSTLERPLGHSRESLGPH
jgi:hypothetical protein